MYPNPYACYTAKQSEVNGLVSTSSKYGATENFSQSNCSYYQQKQQKGEKRKRCGALFILLSLVVLISIFVFVAAHHPKHLDIKTTSLNSAGDEALEQNTEESLTESVGEETNAQTEELKRDTEAQADKSTSQFKDLADTMTSSQEKFNSMSLHKAIQPAISEGHTNLLQPAITNSNIVPKSKINCGPPGDRNMVCCMDVLCGGVLAESMLNNITRENMADGFKCLEHGNFTSCFSDIPAADPLMICMACNNCTEGPVNLNCFDSDTLESLQF